MATAARIAARQQKDGDGITSQLAEKMYAHRGGDFMAVVELHVKETSDEDDGAHGVRLIITEIEVTERGSDLEHHLRDLAKFLWGARQEQPTLLDGEIQPGDADLISDGKAFMTEPEPATV
jgi:hypothetical protein